jgi:hypothetical protein
MIDLHFEPVGETDWNVEGNTEEGIEFIDAWGSGEFQVIDSGRIVIPADSIPAFVDGAAQVGLTADHDGQEGNPFHEEECG